MNWNVFFGGLRALAGIMIAGFGVKYPDILSPTAAVTLGAGVSALMAGWSVQTNLTKPPDIPLNQAIGRSPKV